MGKNTVANKKKKMAKARRKLAERLQLASLSVAELFASAQDHLDNFQYETAQNYSREILKREPGNAKALELSAGLFIEVGNFDRAKNYLSKAVSIQPEVGYRKYLSLAQLLNGSSSLHYYTKGIQIMDNLIKRSEVNVTNSNEEMEDHDKGVNEKKELNSVASSSLNGHLIENACVEYGGEKALIMRDLSSALSSVGELYMTDLCDVENAESLCFKNIERAILIDKNNPEAHQLMASFYLVKEEISKAKSSMEESLSLWLPKCKAVDEENSESCDQVDLCPLSFSSRMNASKILIELDMHDKAGDVLETLIDEDDEVVDVWYLLGWSSYLQEAEDKSAAKSYFLRALEVHKMRPCNDSGIIQHINELLEELSSVMVEEEPAEDDSNSEIEDSSDEEDMDVCDEKAA